MKKFIINLFSFLFFVALTTIAITVVAQTDSTTTQINAIASYLPVSIAGWVIAIWLILEAIFRAFPTVKDYTPVAVALTWISKIANFLKDLSLKANNIK